MGFTNNNIKLYLKVFSVALNVYLIKIVIVFKCNNGIIF